MQFNNFQSTIGLGAYSYDSSAILGKGTTGNVYKGTRNSDRTPMAIKVIDLRTGQNEVTRSLLECEKKALRMLDHEYLIKLDDIIEDSDFCYIITRLYEGGTLKEYIEKHGVFSEQEAIELFRKILAGYAALSDCCIVHRDLKPANIMFTSDKSPVIIDFGYCEIIRAQTMKAFNVGSPSYMSPENYSKTLFSEKSDVWSLGVILYEMLTACTLDAGMDIKEFFKCIINPSFVQQKIQNFSAVIQEVLSGVFKSDPQQRISCHRMKYLFDKHVIEQMSRNGQRGQNAVIQQTGNTYLGMTPINADLRLANTTVPDNKRLNLYGSSIFEDKDRSGGLEFLKRSTLNFGGSSLKGSIQFGNRIHNQHQSQSSHFSNNCLQQVKELSSKSKLTESRYNGSQLNFVDYQCQNNNQPRPQRTLPATRPQFETKFGLKENTSSNYSENLPSKAPSNEAFNSYFNPGNLLQGSRFAFKNETHKLNNVAPMSEKENIRQSFNQKHGQLQITPVCHAEPVLKYSFSSAESTTASQNYFAHHNPQMERSSLGRWQKQGQTSQIVLQPTKLCQTAQQFASKDSRRVLKFPQPKITGVRLL